jgi:hypothetical protein
MPSVVPFEGTHRLGRCMWLSCSRLVEVTSGRSKGIGHVSAYHLGGEARELAWSRDVACTDSLQERGWAGVSQGRVDELDVARRILLADVVRRDVHTAAGRVGRDISVWPVWLQVHAPRTLGGGLVS